MQRGTRNMGHSSSNESEDGVLSTDSPPLCNNGDKQSGGSNGGNILKKGPWTSAEDASLVDYVKKHGEGNWNAVQKHTGLLRCGKSCRLRWANHLRPNLKKGAFTPEEEHLIIELHAKMGNKWARMAAHLPGRTDNEIKNYWNTRIKKRLRAGLPLYPTELCPQAQPENQQCLNSPGLYAGGIGFHDILQSDGYKTPDVMFDSLNILRYRPGYPDASASGSLINGFGCSQFYSFVPQEKGFWKCTQNPDEPMSDYGGGAADEAPSFDSVHMDNSENKMSQSVGLCFRCDLDHTEKLLPLGVNQHSHFTSNGFLSASKTFAGSEKLELPSLQYQETSLGVWDPAPESLDSFVQSPLPPDCPSPRSSGLLEALLYEAKALTKSDNLFSDRATSSTLSSGNITDSEFKGYLEPTSPSGNSMGSTFTGCSPTLTIGSSFGKGMPVGLLNGERNEILNQLDSFHQQQGFATDSIAAFLGDDLGSELNMSAATSAYTSRGLSSCIWNNMPPVCQMSDHP